jgi:hypothetical protein
LGFLEEAEPKSKYEQVFLEGSCWNKRTVVEKGGSHQSEAKEIFEPRKGDGQTWIESQELLIDKVTKEGCTREQLIEERFVWFRSRLCNRAKSLLV